MRDFSTATRSARVRRNLCLGLVNDFRHPQLVLDYIGNIPQVTTVFSTQTYKSDAHVMVNRKDTNAKDVPGNRLAGSALGPGYCSEKCFMSPASGIHR